MWSPLTLFVSGVVILVTTLFTFYWYYQYCFTYWKKKRVPTGNPQFPTGDLTPSSLLGGESLFVRLQNLYIYFKSKGYQHAGIYFFNGPIYFPIDPVLIKRIILTDFNHFVDRGMYINVKKHPLTAHILSMSGDEWRHARAKLTPTFTTGKIKSMFDIVKNETQNLIDTIKPYSEKEDVINIKDLATRFTTDVIASSIFGLECNSLKNPDKEFVRMVNKIFKQSIWKLIKTILEEGLKNPGKILKLTHSDKVVEDYFTKLLRDTIDYRDKNNIIRNDFLNTLLQLRESSNISFTEIVAQSYLFFTAGFETSASTISFCIHELAHNQQIQEELRQEIYEKIGKDISTYTYDDIIKLPYLDRAIKETLRKFPPVPMLNRICVKKYEVPGTDVVIEEDTPVLISNLGLHRDPEYYPDPLKFDPSRFSDENEIVPYTFLPFGEGPRNCIGLRFGLMQTKLGIASLLCHYRFLPSSITPKEVEIDPSAATIVLAVKNEIHTKVVKLV